MTGLLLLATAIAIFGTLIYMRQTALQDARREAIKIGVTLAEQTSRAVQAPDLMLQMLRSRALADDVGTPADLQAALGTIDVFHDLQRWIDELPQVSAFTVIDAAGQVVNASRQWPPPPLDLSQREDYQYLRDHDGTEVYLSAPESGADGFRIAHLARRISGPDGRFLGVVTSALDLHYFQRFYKLVGSTDMSVALFRLDGTLLTRFPPFPQSAFKMPPESPFYANVALGDGAYVSQGVLSSAPVMVAVHALRDYPLVVGLGIPLGQILGPWWYEAALIGAGTISSFICVVLLLRALGLQFQRLERSEAFLVTQNETLRQAKDRVQVQASVLSYNQRELAEKTAALTTTLQTMDQGLLTISSDGRVTIYNRRVLELLDLPESLLAGKPLYADVIAYQRSMGEFAVDGQVLQPAIMSGRVPDQPGRYERARPNGRAIEVHSIPLGDGGMVRTFTDITDRRRSEEQVRYFARHDSMTKLVNRVAFKERLEQAIVLADQTGRSVAVLCLDLDRFKLVNDMRGHAIGDKLLAEVSARLLSAVRDTDTVARIGGDEFAVVQPMVEQPAHAESLAARLLDLISRPYDIDGAAALVGVSIGIAIYPAHADTAEALLQRADTALYQVKAEGRGVYRVFDAAMEAAQRDGVQLEQDLRHALDRNELSLAYQPIVDAATRKVLAYEALLRWNHPLRGPVSPAVFIPRAEMTGLILPIGLWVLEAACAEAASWPDGLRVSVNLSPLQFRQGELVGQVRGALERSGLAADRLSLEVTEGLLLDGTQQVLGMMQELRALGVRFSLDDFGTAHAGLSYLRSFPFDAIKIDKSFVQDAVTRLESRAIVKTILVMAGVLKLNVIAEGVEDRGADGAAAADALPADPGLPHRGGPCRRQRCASSSA